ncbi:hypothetical protein PspLS_10786 [Pyricularia sp. CBS 133598]|nr:hypothetical protein PspLS_10786 [Pyricularia sp. CBS 133598]
MISGTLGRSSALAADTTAVSIEELNALNSSMRMYIMLASRTSTGTKPSAKFPAPPTNARLIIRPRKAWKRIRMFESWNRYAMVREARSPIITHAALESPWLRVSATTRI